MLERAQDRVAVPTPDGGTVLVDPGQHRAEVVRRLLCGGVSAATLTHLLPDWSQLITEVDRALATATVAGSPGDGSTVAPRGS